MTVTHFSNHADENTQQTQSPQLHLVTKKSSPPASRVIWFLLSFFANRKLILLLAAF